MSELEGKKGLFWQLMDSAYAATGIQEAPAHPPVSPKMQKLYDAEIAKVEQRKMARAIGDMPDPRNLIVNEPYNFNYDFRSPQELGIGPSEQWKHDDDARMRRLAQGIGSPTEPAPKREQAPAYLTRSSSEIAAMGRTDPEAAQAAQNQVTAADAEIWRGFLKFRDAERKAGRWDGSGPIDLRKGKEEEPSS